MSRSSFQRRKAGGKLLQQSVVLGRVLLEPWVALPLSIPTQRKRGSEQCLRKIKMRDNSRVSQLTNYQCPQNITARPSMSIASRLNGHKKQCYTSDRQHSPKPINFLQNRHFGFFLDDNVFLREISEKHANKRNSVVDPANLSVLKYVNRGLQLTLKSKSTISTTVQYGWIEAGYKVRRE